MPVDSFKFLPRLIRLFYKANEVAPEFPIPWTALEKPLSACTVGLITTGGLYLKDQQPPFDIERERVEPEWGDPSFREIPASVRPEDIGVSHLHVNPAAVEQDFNILLPLAPVKELVAAGEVGALAEHHYSFMGYQGYPPNSKAWRTTYAPQVAASFLSQGVDCVLLTPS